MKSALLISLLSLLLFSSSAQLLINEIQVTNYETVIDEENEFGDWIELFNAVSQV